MTGNKPDRHMQEGYVNRYGEPLFGAAFSGMLIGVGLWLGQPVSFDKTGYFISLASYLGNGFLWLVVAALIASIAYFRFRVAWPVKIGCFCLGICLVFPLLLPFFFLEANRPGHADAFIALGGLALGSNLGRCLGALMANRLLRHAS